MLSEICVFLESISQAPSLLTPPWIPFALFGMSTLPFGYLCKLRALCAGCRAVGYPQLGNLARRARSMQEYLKERVGIPNDSSARPQTGVGLPNGRRRRKSGAPKFQICGCSAKSQKKTYFIRGFFEESFYRKCSWRAYATFTEGFPVIFHEGLFLPGITDFLADFMCRLRTRSRMFAFGWLAVACAGLGVAS